VASSLTGAIRPLGLAVSIAAQVLFNGIGPDAVFIHIPKLYSFNQVYTVKLVRIWLFYGLFSLTGAIIPTFSYVIPVAHASMWLHGLDCFPLVGFP
jgi:hypothetical protein